MLLTLNDDERKEAEKIGLMGKTQEELEHMTQELYGEDKEKNPNDLVTEYEETNRLLLQFYNDNRKA